MRNILARLDVKPEHPSQDELAKRWPAYQRKLQKQEIAVTGSLKKGKAQKRALLESKLYGLLKDLDAFVDYCLARYIVWRETRGGRTRGAQ